MQSTSLVDARHAFVRALARADEVGAQEPPQSEPYKFKYAARELLVRQWFFRLGKDLSVVRAVTPRITACRGALEQKSARAGIEVQLDGAAADSVGATELREMLWRLDSRIGVSHIRTEETPEGESLCFRAACALAHRVDTVCRQVAQAQENATSSEDGARRVATLRQACLVLALDLMDASNFDAILLSSWGQTRRSLALLRLAKRAYITVERMEYALEGSASPSRATLTATDVSAAGEAVVSADRIRRARRAVFASHVLTKYYLAQVYQALERPEAAATYIEGTVRLQLLLDPTLRYALRGDTSDGNPTAESRADADGTTTTDDIPEHLPEGEEPLDAIAWSRNVTRLSEFYRNSRRWVLCAHMIQASGLMLDRVAHLLGPVSDEGAGESLETALAEVDAHWGRFCLSLIHVAHLRELSAAIEHDMVGSVGDIGSPRPRRRRQSPAPTVAGYARRLEAMAYAIGHRRDAGESKQDDGLDWDVDADDSCSDDDEEVLSETAQPWRSAVIRGNEDGDGTEPVQPPERGTGEHPSSLTDPALPLARFVQHCRAEVEDAGRAVPCSRWATPPPPTRIRDMDSARPVFQEAFGAMERARQTLVLDGFATSHTSLCRDTAELYKNVATFEKDVKRKQAMFHRAVGYLAPILGLLNPSVYTVEHKEVAFLAAQAAQELMDIRIHRLEERVERGGPKLSAPEVRSVNKLADQAMFLYNHMIRCYDDKRVPRSSFPPLPTCLKQPRLPEVVLRQGPLGEARTEELAHGGYAGGDLQSKLPGATEIEEHNVEAFLTCHFCIARLLGKRVEPDFARRIADTQQSLERYEWLVHSAPAITPSDSDHVFEREMEICREMAQLLPAKIRMLEQTAARAGRG